MLLLASGCSRSDDEEEVDVSIVPTLFAEGFDGAAPQPAAEAQANPPADTAQVAASDDPRAGIPFDRSDRLTGRVETAMAGQLAKDFTLRFALADAGEFVRSGKVRNVWQRELAARNYPADNLAGPTALMFGVAWELANGRKLTPADHAAILRQVTAKLRGDPLERQNDEQRQIQADLRLITAGLWLEEAYVRGPYPDQMRELSDAVHRDMQKMSTNDMRDTTMTPEGFSED
ncbi:hypothetical protein GRI97_06300 [Altererythrobacter xixiisoli]|uniref:Uncharacterized protein n=1 Tax=Croceibacterium xixiisoli TaxID=1476466 RepID=A0A6I4TV11_9SPHN|nr:hypothetical protein [Croceibacterium xixiisoli]MXO98597.1 hypothetical protein [Croceibacterium xixiisoli]